MTSFRCLNIIRKDRYMKKTITLLIIFSCSFIFGVLLGGCEIPDTVNAGAAFSMIKVHIVMVVIQSFYH